MEGDNGLIKAKEGKEWYSKERKGDSELEFLCLVVEQPTVYFYIFFTLEAYQNKCKEL